MSVSEHSPPPSAASDPMPSRAELEFGATPAELERYERDGFFLRDGVFDATELEVLRAAAERAHQRIIDAADQPEAGPVTQIDNQKYQDVLGARVKWEWNDQLRAARSMEPSGQLDPMLDVLLDDPRLWQPIVSINGSDELSIFSDKLNVKRPGGAPFPWHQEGPYWQYGAKNLASIVTAMVYLDDATLENGCLWLIPGSHRSGALKGLENRGVLGALYTDVDLVEGEGYPAALAAGSVLWFHRDIVHGSQTNRSGDNRRLFLLAYQVGHHERWPIGPLRPIDTASPPTRSRLSGAEYRRASLPE